MTDFYVLDRTARTIAGPMTEAAADAVADATHTKSSDLGYLQDLKNQLDDAAAGGGGGSGGLTLAEIQAALDDGSLTVPGGGAGSLLAHHTAVEDQTVAAAAIPATGGGFPAVLPNTSNPLWRISGPGMFTIGVYFEVNQVNDTDSFTLGILPEASPGSDSLFGSSMGGARADRDPNDAVDADWTRFNSSPQWVFLAPGQHIDVHLEISGYDQTVDDTTPPAGDIQFRNMHVFAIKLDVVPGAGGSGSGGTAAHDWVTNGDANGIFYALGTLAGSGFSNPAGVGGPVVATESGVFSPWDPPPTAEYLTDRDSTVNVMITTPDGEGNWVQWDFGVTRAVSLREYTVRSRWDQNTLHPTAWQLQGSNDGATWDVLDAVGAAGFSAMDQWQHFNCDNPNQGPYRYIRILDTANANLVLGEVELYGDLVE